MTALKIYEDYNYIVSEDDNEYIYYDKKLSVHVTTDKQVRSSKVFKDGNLLSEIGFKLFYFDYHSYTDVTINPIVKKVQRLAQFSIGNCIHLHFEKEIVEQVFAYCKKHIKNDNYSITVHNDKAIYPYYQYIVEITDLNYPNLKYKAIVRNGIVYFTWTFEDESKYDNFFLKNFNIHSIDRFHYDDDIITTFMTMEGCIDIHYKASLKEYDIMVGNYNDLLDDNILKTTKWGDRIIIRQNYDIDFVARKALELVIINDPKDNFINMLKEMELIDHKDKLTVDIVDLYQMVTI